MLHAASEPCGRWLTVTPEARLSQVGPARQDKERHQHGRCSGGGDKADEAVDRKIHARSRMSLFAYRFSVALATLACPALAASASPVVSLSSSGFDDTVLGRPELWIVDFYAPWCAHCQTLAPHFDAAAGRLSGIVAFGKVDCTVHTEIAERYDIHSYPTVLAFQPGSKKQDEPDVLEISDGTADDLVHAALAELSMIVLQRSREESRSDGDAISSEDAHTVDKESCTKHIDPESGLEVEVCSGSSSDSHDVIQPQAKPKLPNLVDVAIVGGGPAGLGAAIALKDAGVGNYVVLERGQIGETFRRWPDEMRFITPSFYSNPFKVPDLNAVNPHSSPAFVLNREHPSGLEYAEYLDIVTEYYQLPVYEGEDVVRIVPSTTEMPSSLDSAMNATFSGFELETASGVSIFARYVLWAGGEFQYPKIPSKLRGAELGVHSSAVSSWRNHTHTVTADRQSMLVVGGYESGIDAAVNLAAQGVQNVFVFDKGAPWANREGDPSEILSPRTIERLETTIAAAAEPDAIVGKIHLVQQHAASIVDTAAAAGHDDEEPEGRSGARFELTTEDGRVFSSNSPPVLATGFKGNTSVVADLFGWGEDTDYPTLTGNDESVKTPGLFLLGSQVRHQAKKDLWIFCFIYKYRARFPVVARTIAERLGKNHKSLADWESHGMYMAELNPSAACACSGKKS